MDEISKYWGTSKIFGTIIWQLKVAVVAGKWFKKWFKQAREASGRICLSWLIDNVPRSACRQL